MGRNWNLHSREKRKLKDTVWTRDDWTCFWCSEKVVRPKFTPGKRMPLKSATVDHIVPHCRGGTDEIENLITACSDCNVRRGDMPAEDYARLRWSHAMEAAE